MVYPAMLGASVIGISVLVRFIVSSVDFDIIEAGHMTHTSLKTILFRKNFRMSSAVNKDFSTSEIDSIIMSDTDKFWDVIWEMHQYIEVPVEIICGIYLCYSSIGRYAFISFVINTCFLFYQRYKNKEESSQNKKIRELADKRQLYVTESFNNIKTLKLYGWEEKFKNKIEEIYQEEEELARKIMAMQKVSDFLENTIKASMFILTVWAFWYGGNTIVLSSMLTANRGINYFNENINRVNRLYSNSFSIQEAMERLCKFYNAAEN
jgi:ABC-type multidrug transport system fused ATPase/permease subunit